MLKYVVALQNFLAEPVRRDRGVTAVEYGLIVAGIALLIVGAVVLLGGRLAAVFNGVNP
jgi:pilus assembly protein Flp/PilA